MKTLLVLAMATLFGGSALAETLTCSGRIANRSYVVELDKEAQTMKMTNDAGSITHGPYTYYHSASTGRDSYYVASGHLYGVEAVFESRNSNSAIIYKHENDRRYHFFCTFR
jgi:hypothetical protein